MHSKNLHESDNDEHLAARRILAVTEEELQRIVLDIHDGPVQYIFAALSQVKLVQKQLEQGKTISQDALTHHLNQVDGLLGQSLQGIRHFLGTFRPPDFPRRSLADILQGLIIQHEMLTGCEITFFGYHQAIPSSLPVKIALYRICQEALSNSYRHSDTKEQCVRLSREDERVVLEICDKGRGFVPPPLTGQEATEREEHIGLRGMRDRIGLVGGQFELEAAPGAGVTIRVKAPIHE